MKAWALNHLCCPICLGRLKLSVFDEGPGSPGSEIVNGLLRCQCQRTYPIIAGVPRFLLGPLRELLPSRYPHWFRAYWRDDVSGDGADSGTSTDSPKNVLAKLRAVKSFSYEWLKISEMLPEWERNFHEYFEPWTEEFLRNKLLLDLGCGMGRHISYAAPSADTIYGVDLSWAVEAAYRNNASLDNVCVVQADLDHLPFRQSLFDIVYSLGIIHHLPDPERAFNSIVSYVRTGGWIRVYLYRDWTRDTDRWRRFRDRWINRLRRYSWRMPHPLLYALTFALSATAYTTFILPRRHLYNVPFMAPVVRRLPLKSYSTYPFRVLHNDIFDQFSAPIENRYSRAEVEAWLHRAALHQPSLFPLAGHGGWVAYGQRAR